MALVNAYCTVAELRAQFADERTALNDALLERVINASSRAIDNYCGRRFWQDAEVATRTFVPIHPTILFVDDISTRTGLVIATGSDGVTFPTTLTSSQYVLEPRNADVVAAGSTGSAYAFWQIKPVGLTWTTHCDDLPTVSVTAKFGWSAVPPEVTEACILKAAALFKRKDSVSGVLGFNEFGGVTRIGRNDPDVQELLSKFEWTV